ncbi:rhodanese-like domain-containing protein [Pontibacter harenae]|uniref:rhodanese-like domain-containing protein n=1 Tax=Pontibacter harenae TaxID=2894083 RepID=UPI001E48D449|nr:rhodanese-like domain-containing protein [Pontibacter harenae]MCC9166240.1 rhodanese-like domain-containing protein [Pontibacter harenae]
MKFIFFSLLACTLSFSALAQQGTSSAVKTLTPTEFKGQRLSMKTVVLDVRTPEEYNAGHLEGAENSDYRSGQFAKELKELNKKKTYYLYCASGNRSGKAAQLMKEAGFEKVYNIGAYQDLREAGFPTEMEIPELDR